MTKVITSVVCPSDILSVYHAIPEFNSSMCVDDINLRLGDSEHIALIAYIDGNTAGFKLGYSIEKTIFYSWLGGVLPAFRNHGIAQKLLVDQESLCRIKGYSTLRVKTRNRYASMLRLLLKNKYHIVDVEKKGTRDDYRILLEKNL